MTQSYADRKARGGRLLQMWVDADTWDRLGVIMRIRGVSVRRDAVVWAVQVAAREGTKQMRCEKMARQGDVLILRAKPRKDVVTAATDPRGLVLAEGETSGHHHAVFGRGSKLFRFRDTTSAARALVVGRAGAEVRVVGGECGGVPRHLPVSLAPGDWEVRIQRSWTGEDERRSQQVAD